MIGECYICLSTKSLYSILHLDPEIDYYSHEMCQECLSNLIKPICPFCNTVILVKKQQFLDIICHSELFTLVRTGSKKKVPVLFNGKILLLYPLIKSHPAYKSFLYEKILIFIYIQFIIGIIIFGIINQLY